MSKGLLSVFWCSLGHIPPPPPHTKKKKKLIPIFSIFSNFLPIIKTKMRINTYALCQ